jgi:hypothetical protein
VAGKHGNDRVKRDDRRFWGEQNGRFSDLVKAHHLGNYQPDRHLFNLGYALFISPVLSSLFGQEDSQRHAILLEPAYIHKSHDFRKFFLASKPISLLLSGTEIVVADKAVKSRSKALD